MYAIDSVGWSVIILGALLVSYLLPIMSGWSELSRRFASAREPKGVAFRWCWILLGAVSYRFSTVIIVSDEGIFLKLNAVHRILYGAFLLRNHAPVLIPWKRMNLSVDRDPWAVVSFWSPLLFRPKPPYLVAMVGHVRLVLPREILRAIPETEARRLAESEHSPGHTRSVS